MILVIETAHLFKSLFFSAKVSDFSSSYASSFYHFFCYPAQNCEARKKSNWMYHTYESLSRAALSGKKSSSSCSFFYTSCLLYGMSKCTIEARLAKVKPQWLSSHLHCIQLCSTSGLVPLPLSIFYACAKQFSFNWMWDFFLPITWAYNANGWCSCLWRSPK